MNNDDGVGSENDPSLGRRTSRREKKPTTKVDLGYEEPKPIKGVKLTGAAKEIFRKCEEVLYSMKEEFTKVVDLSAKAVRFDQEIKKLREGHYRSTVMLGNAIRKFLNSLIVEFTTSQNISSRVAYIVNKFEESFSPLDNKTLFEESKIETIGRKKSGVFGGKKNLKRQNSKTALDMDRPMSDEEKKNLSRSIRNLTAPQLKGIIKIVKDMFPERDGMLEFDIDSLPPRKCRELEEYVRKVKGLPRKGGNTPTSSGKPKNLNRQPSRSSASYQNSGNQGGASGTGIGYGSIGRSAGGMMGANHPSLMNQTNDLMGNSKILDESSDSDSKSSNSSIGSQEPIRGDSMNAKGSSALPHIGSMGEGANQFSKQNSTGDIQNVSQANNANNIGADPAMKKYNSTSGVNQ
jgi:hypothetical protein